MPSVPPLGLHSDKSLGEHSVSLTRTVFIEHDDFRETDAPDYFGLAPGKTAGLRYAGFVRVVEVRRDDAGAVSSSGGVGGGCLHSACSL